MIWLTMYAPLLAHRHFTPYFAGRTRERLLLVTLAPDDRIVQTEIIAEGDERRVLLDLPGFYRGLDRYAGQKIVLAHNHPHRDSPQPSEDDHHFTREVLEYARPRRITLIEHYVYCHDRLTGIIHPQLRL